MPRKKLIISKILPYHINGRANNRDWFYLPTEQIWDICLDQLLNITIVFGFRVHAFVLMSNHYHLLGSTPDANLGEAMNYFMREVSKTINRKTGRINHVFGGAYKGSLIEDHLHYFNALRYIYQNPIRAGICNRVEDYRYSSFAVIHGQTLPLPLYTSIFEPKSAPLDNVNLRLGWLNKKVEPACIKAISQGLQRTTFQMPRDRIKRQPFQFPIEDSRELDALLNQK